MVRNDRAGISGLIVGRAFPRPVARGGPAVEGKSCEIWIIVNENLDAFG
jgi:hypothetical protein